MQIHLLFHSCDTLLLYSCMTFHVETHDRHMTTCIYLGPLLSYYMREIFKLVRLIFIKHVHLNRTKAYYQFGFKPHIQHIKYIFPSQSQYITCISYVCFTVQSFNMEEMSIHKRASLESHEVFTYCSHLVASDDRYGLPSSRSTALNVHPYKTHQGLFTQLSLPFCFKHQTLHNYFTMLNRNVHQQSNRKSLGQKSTL